MSERVSNDLTDETFQLILKKYGDQFSKKPETAEQLSSFCQRYVSDDLKFTFMQLKSFFNAWKLTNSSLVTTKTENVVERTFCNSMETLSMTNGSHSGSHSGESVASRLCVPSASVDWESHWQAYCEMHNATPKKATHLYTFLKEVKGIQVRYKDARNAFTRLLRQQNKETITEEEQKDLRESLKLKINEHTSEEEKQHIKELFMKILQLHREKMSQDPVIPYHFFNFIREETNYNVKYCDVKCVLEYALKEKWYTPMRKIKKAKKVNVSNSNKYYSDPNRVNSSDGETTGTCDEESKMPSCDGSEAETQNEIVEILQPEKLDEEKKVEIVKKENVTEQEFDEIMTEYCKISRSKPKEARQILNFCETFLNTHYKYKAIRIAWGLYKHKYI